MNPATLLYRQINPAWIQLGRVTSQAFKPTPKDQKRLSVYDGDQLTAAAAWEHYTAELGFSSVGVLGVTVAECTAIGLPAEPDPEPFPAHAVIRFDTCTTSQIETRAKQLRNHAQTRGWLHKAEDA